MACETLLQWQKAHANMSHSKEEEEELNNSGYFCHEQSRWRKPEEGEIKFDIDAKIFKEEDCYNIVMRLRGRCYNGG